MRLGGELAPGLLVARRNRFLAEVRAGGLTVLAHVPNSGRLGELLVPGAPVTVARAGPGRGGRAGERPGRKTTHDLVAVIHRGVRVCIDARLAGRLLAEAVAEGRLARFRGWRVRGTEVGWGESRLDLLLEAPRGDLMYVEAKSVTLVRGDVALFPDAPTARGARHLGDLGRAAAAGHRAAVVFVVQREDAEGWAPNQETDPGFAAALRAAVAAGVEAVAVRCRVGEDRVEVTGEIPVRL